MSVLPRVLGSGVKLEPEGPPSEPHGVRCLASGCFGYPQADGGGVYHLPRPTSVLDRTTEGRKELTVAVDLLYFDPVPYLPSQIKPSNSCPIRRPLSRVYPPNVARRRTSLGKRPHGKTGGDRRLQRWRLAAMDILRERWEGEKGELLGSAAPRSRRRGRGVGARRGG